MKDHPLSKQDSTTVTHMVSPSAFKMNVQNIVNDLMCECDLSIFTLHYSEKILLPLLPQGHLFSKTVVCSTGQPAGRSEQ